jgi:Fibronectin type III domain
VTLVSSGDGTGTLSGTPAAGTGGSYPITITANNGVTPNATQSFTLTVHQAPAITSADSATFVIGTAGSFTVTTAGNPTSAITETGSLPADLTFTDNGDGTATLAGTAAAGTGGSYPITLTAANGVAPNATEAFTIIVPVPPSPPTITSVTPGNSSVTVSWAPGSDGGLPILSYTATATPVTVPMALLVPGTESCTVPAPATSCTITGLTNGTSYTFTVVATNSQGTGRPSPQSNPVIPTANGAIQGYWMATSTGGVFTNGAALSYGSPAGLTLNAPIVALAPTPDRKGYWMVGSDGGVFAYGDATFYGSTGGQHLNAPIVGMASTSDGHGYWLVASDGGVFAYGDAVFAGSTGGQHLNAPVVGIAGNGNNGYWLVASDGGVFAYGTASFDGSAGALKLVSPVVGIAAVAGGGGYYLAAADGGVFAYGSAPFLGSASGIADSRIVGITAGAGGGYTLASSVGSVYAYGTGYYGSQGSTQTTGPFIGISS